MKTEGGHRGRKREKETAGVGGGVRECEMEREMAKSSHAHVIENLSDRERPNTLSDRKKGNTHSHTESQPALRVCRGL